VKQISVHGINISYVEQGEGNPLVLVHGIPTSSYLWRDMIDELSARGRVIAPDLPGFGLSDPPPNSDYSISNYAHIFESFLEAISVNEPTLICHDFGGPIVLSYALRNPDKYERLIILDTFLHRDDLPPWPLSARIAKIRPFGEIFMGLMGTSITRSGLEQGVKNKSLISNQIVREYYMPDGDQAKLTRTMLGTLRIDYSDDMGFIEDKLWTIEKPTLVLWADSDTYFPPAVGERIHKAIKGSQLMSIPDCGHFIPEEQPDMATLIIVEWLSTTECERGDDR
jgi:pimeloyl-ACP methyl ester carboxylesterase